MFHAEAPRPSCDREQRCDELKPSTSFERKRGAARATPLFLREDEFLSCVTEQVSINLFLGGVTKGIKDVGFGDGL